jgi:hypothetical protein
MILTQNSLVLYKSELDAIEFGTFNDRDEIIRCGSSMTRSKTSIAKVRNEYETKEEFEKRVKKRVIIDRETGEAAPSLSADDIIKTNDLFERNTELRCGRGVRKLSPRSKTKIRQKITAWSRTHRPKQNQDFYFVTITLTSKQRGDGKHYMAMLNNFMTRLRQVYGLKNYLYVNEIQKKKTQNLHTHIIIDQWLPVGMVNYMWCTILKNNGYTFTHEGQTEPDPLFPIGKDGANPVDIDRIRSLKGLQYYVTKYISKNESEVDCAIWNCSNNISRLFTSVKIHKIMVYSSLMCAFHKRIEAKLTDGNTLHIHLLSQYTGIQKKLFSINKDVITGKLDREKFLKQLKEKQCC